MGSCERYLAGDEKDRAVPSLGDQRLRSGAKEKVSAEWSVAYAVPLTTDTSPLTLVINNTKNSSTRLPPILVMFTTDHVHLTESTYPIFYA